MILLNYRNHSPQSGTPGQYLIEIRHIQKLLNHTKAIENQSTSGTHSLYGDVQTYSRL